MNVLLETYYILLPIVATTLIGWVGLLLKQQKQKESLREEEYQKKNLEERNMRKANSVGIMLVLRYMLKRYHSEYVFQAKITYSQYSEWVDLYNAYKALGGNSIADEWNEDVEELPKYDSINEPSVFESILNRVADDTHKHN